MSKLELSYSGYVCAPYLHTHESVELKESWINSKNIEQFHRKELTKKVSEIINSIIE